ncbi:MAG: hypothetical protein AAFP26_08220, partial [Planctomycetota bacterium]
RARDAARNLRSVANMKQLATGGASYAADFSDRIFSYSWKAGDTRSIVGGMRPRTFRDDQEAASWQQTDILRRATGRSDSSADRDVFLGLFTTRLPHRRYSHVILLDYLTDFQPEPIAASPLDRNLLRWQSDPIGSLGEVPYSGTMDPGSDTDSSWRLQGVKQRWAYASTYQVVPAAWNQNGLPSYTPVEDTPHLFAGYDANGARTNSVPLGNRKLSEVSFPSGKVHMFEEFDRATNSAGIYFAYDSAKVNLMFFDASVRTLSSSDANPGWNPAFPSEEWKQRYVKLDKFPDPIGEPGTELFQRFRWTRGGLGGIDYGGREIGRPESLGPQD